MKTTAESRIKELVEKEFAGIRAELERHLSPDVTVDHARLLLAQHVPELVVGRAQLLLDSLLGFLMEDAMALLRDAPTEVKNQFFSQDLRAAIRSTFSLDPKELTFSFDRRLLYGGGAAAAVLIAGGTVVIISLPTVVPPVLIGLGSIVASAVAFRIAYSAGTGATRRKMREDVENYLRQSKTEVMNWLLAVVKAFGEAFDSFVSQHGIPLKDAP